jgi:hypothetical protein
MKKATLLFFLVSLMMFPSHANHCYFDYGGSAIKVDGDHSFTLSYDGGNFLLLDDRSETHDAWLDAPLVDWKRIYPLSETSFVAKGWPGVKNKPQPHP